MTTLIDNAEVRMTTAYYVPTRKERLHRIPLFCRVEPLPRPRGHAVGGFVKVYQPKTNQKVLLANLGAVAALNLDQPVIVDLYMNFKKAPTSKLHYPTGRNHGDEDNLRKAVCDALVANKHLRDDSLILGGQTMKWWGEEDFTVIDVFSVNVDPKRYDLEAL